MWMFPSYSHTVIQTQEVILANTNSKTNLEREIIMSVKAFWVDRIPLKKKTLPQSYYCRSSKNYTQKLMTIQDNIVQFIKPIHFSSTLFVHGDSHM